MNNNNQPKCVALSFAIFASILPGCSSIGRNVSDVGLAGLGGVAGYELSGKEIGGAAIGAVAGYAASKIAQTQIQSEIAKAEKEGYQRAMNQAVKQQYWIVQNQQKASETPRYLPVRVPTQKVDGVLTNPTIQYIKIDP